MRRGDRQLPSIEHVHRRYRDWEAGRRMPSSGYRRLVAAAFDVSVDALFTTARTGPLDPDDQQRLTLTAADPSRLDTGVVDALAVSLAAHRRLEDSIGSAALVDTVLAQQRLIAGLVQDARGPNRPALIDIATQHVQFSAWLLESSRHGDEASTYYARGLEWAAEIGEPSMLSTLTNMRGHVAWLAGDLRTMLERSRVAQTHRDASPGVLCIAAQQEGRAHAMLGNRDDCERALDRAHALAVDVNPSTEPPWLYFFTTGFLHMQRGLAHLYLGDYHRAIELLTAGLAGLPAAIADSGYVAWYRYDLARCHLANGDIDTAAKLAADAAAAAHETRSAGLLRELRRLHAAMRVRRGHHDAIDALGDLLARPSREAGE